MLVLSRRVGDVIYIGDDIIVKIVGLDRNKVRIGVEAPKGVPIIRDDIKRDTPKQGDTNGSR